MAEPADDLALAAVASDLERANGRQEWRLLPLLDPAEVAKTEPDAAPAGVSRRSGGTAITMSICTSCAATTSTRCCCI
jgi:hypothetical protein